VWTFTHVPPLITRSAAARPAATATNLGALCAHVLKFVEFMCKVDMSLRDVQASD